MLAGHRSSTYWYR